MYCNFLIVDTFCGWFVSALLSLADWFDLISRCPGFRPCNSPSPLLSCCSSRVYLILFSLFIKFQAFQRIQRIYDNILVHMVDLKTYAIVVFILLPLMLKQVEPPGSYMSWSSGSTLIGAQNTVSLNSYLRFPSYYTSHISLTKTLTLSRLRAPHSFSYSSPDRQMKHLGSARRSLYDPSRLSNYGKWIVRIDSLVVL